MLPQFGGSNRHSFDAHPKANTPAHTLRQKKTFVSNRETSFNYQKTPTPTLLFFGSMTALQAWPKPVSQQKLLRPVIDSRARLKYYAYAAWASFGNAPCHFAAAAARLHAAKLCMLHGSHPKTDIMNTHMFICVCVQLCVSLAVGFWQASVLLWRLSNCTCQFSPQAACFAHSNDVLTDYYQIFAYAIEISYFPSTD